LIAAADLAALHACAWLALSVAAPGQRRASLHVYAHLLPLLSVAAVVCFSVSGLYRNWSRQPAVNLIAALLAGEWLYVTVWVSLIGWEPRWAIPRGAIACAAAVQFAGLAVVRLTIRDVVRSHRRAERGAIVAADTSRAEALRRRLADAAAQWLRIEACLTPEEFLALRDEEVRWDTVLVEEKADEKTQVLRRASRLGKTALLVPGLFELWMLGARTMEVDDLLMVRLSPPHLRAEQRSVKRLIDVAGAIALLAAASPVLLLAAALVRLTSRGPAFYRQTRVGANGREYSLWKLRTMVDGAERDTGPVLAARQDARVTAVGRWLRATRIDELPQLFNVLFGEMSLVGPRPERPEFVRALKERLPGYEFRLAVKPGITGLAQVYGRYSTAPQSKLRFDLMYIYNYSLLLDLQILFKTVLTVLQPGQAEGWSAEREAEEPGGDWAKEFLASAPATPK
jgi:exopolysaccharide biosynthesis polyprenyl glycosylphosphotransferase